jgi:hypothetical protein
MYFTCAYACFNPFFTAMHYTFGLALGEEADFEALNYLPALNLIQSTKLHLSTEPAFLPNACYRFGVLFRPLVCRSFWSCGWTDTLFAKLGFERWLVRLGNVCGCEALAFCLYHSKFKIHIFLHVS